MAQPTPILTRDSQFVGSDWNDPCVIPDPTGVHKFVMFASSDHAFDFVIAIYRLVSDDGKTWALSPTTPVFEADSSSSAWDHHAVETPSVVYFHSVYHLFYTGYPATYTDPYSYRVGHATSSDGLTWVRDPNNPLVAPTTPTTQAEVNAGTQPPVNLDFDQYITAEPAAVVFGDHLFLYFSALGANAAAGGILQVIGLTTSADGSSWTPPVSALEPDQTLYPRATWRGYSTPAALVLGDDVHLFFDVYHAPSQKQTLLHHASSADGRSNWRQDEVPTFRNTDFPWTSNEIRAPSALVDGAQLLLWFAGDDSATLSIGFASAPNPSP